MLDEFGIIGVTLVAAVIAAYAQYLFKSHVSRFSFRIREVLRLLKHRFIFLGLFIYLVSLALYLVALKSGQLSFVYPIFSSVFVFVILISRFMLGEEIGTKRAIGLALVILGIAIISFTY